MKNNTATRKILSLLMAVVLALGMSTFAPETARAAMPAPAVGDPSDGVDFNDSTGLLSPGSGIYYGAFKHAISVSDAQFGLGTPTYAASDEPVLWRIMGEDQSTGTGDGKITLMSEYALDSRQFNAVGGGQIWETSAIRSWLNGSFFDSYSAAEKLGIPQTIVKTSTYVWNTMVYVEGSTRTTNDYIYLPWGTYSGSLGNQGKVWPFADDGSGTIPSVTYLESLFAKLKSGTIVCWWLRSVGSDTNVNVLGPVTWASEVNSNSCHAYLGVRPVFKLNPASVIFASEIVSSGGDGMGTIDADSSNYSAAAVGAKNYKLTVVGDNSGADVGTLTGVPTATQYTIGTSLSLTGLTASQTGTNYTINYKIVAAGTPRTIVGYGQTAASNTGLSIDTSGLAGGTSYDVYVWLQKNKEINSNEGSTPQYFTMTVLSAPTITPETAAFDKYSGSANNKDIAVTLDLGGNSLTGVQMDNASLPLVLDTDYSVSGGVYTFSKAWLARLSNGSHTIQFVTDYPGVGNPKLTITVTDSTPRGGGDTNFIVKFDSNGGSAVANKSVAEGNKLTKPADPIREGYIFTGWFTDKECTIKYDFTAKVAKSLTLYAGWEKAQAGLPDLFSDDNGHWAEDYINSLGAQEYVSGIGGGKYAPDAPLTRAQFVQILYNVWGEGDTASPADPFDDTAPGEWYEKALNWAFAEKLISGYNAQTFGPGDPITREQMALLVLRAAEKFGITLTSANAKTKFADDGDISDWAYDAVYAMQQAGIISGRPDGSFDPAGSLTRAEMAKVMYGLLELAGMIGDDYLIG